MDVVCKNCGHSIDDHLPEGCFHCENGTLSVNNTCTCSRIPSEVAGVLLTEQQARLDTNRQQIAVLVSERDALQKMFDRERDDYAELKKKLERVEAMHFALKGAVRYARDMTLSETIRQAMIIALERDKNYE